MAMTKPPSPRPLSVIRVLTLAFGCVAQLFVIGPNWQGWQSLIPQLLFSAWVLLPFILFFLLTRKIGTIGLVAISGATLSLLHGVFLYTILTSRSSTAAIAFVFTPLYELLPVLIVLIPKSRGIRICVALLAALLGMYFGYPKYLAYVAQHTESSVTLRRIFESRFSGRHSVQMALADNKMTPAEILTELSGSTNIYVLRDVGANPNTPVDALVSIAKSTKDYTSLNGVAGNPNTPVEVLRELASRTAADWELPRERLKLELYQSYVFARLATNPNSPVAVLNAITESQYRYVGEALLRNPNTTCKILERWVKHENEYLVGLVRKRMESKCY